VVAHPGPMSRHQESAYTPTHKVKRCITMINPAIQQSQARGLTFSLLKELAFRVHPRYGYAFPKLQTLASILRVSIRTVQRHVRKLEELGELRVLRAHGRGLNNRYFLTALEKVTVWHSSTQTKEKKASDAGIIPGAPASARPFSLSQGGEAMLARWLTKGSRLWRTIMGT
jgi:DNA-binding transcriptional regulator YhcF (GntR family)